MGRVPAHPWGWSHAAPWSLPYFSAVLKAQQSAQKQAAVYSQQKACFCWFFSP